MTLLYNGAEPILSGQNVRPPLGSLWNGQAYWLTLYPELGRDDRTVLVVKMILQFQFDDSGGEWTQGEKVNFAHGFVDSVVEVWSGQHRIRTKSKVPAANCRNVGVVFDFPYYIDGWHSDDDFELSVLKIESGGFQVSTCNYSRGNSYLDSEDPVPVSKGADMLQRGVVHEFGHMLGLNDEYPDATDGNTHHLDDVDSVMHSGERVRRRHYAPFAAWLTAQYARAARLHDTKIVYKVGGIIDMHNALL